MAIQARGVAAGKRPGIGPDRVLGGPSMSTEEPSGESGDGGKHECPWGGCSQAFDSLRNVSIHHTKAHGESMDIERKRDRRYKTDAEHPCPNCDKAFGTRQGLGQHHSSAHGVSIGEYERPEGEHTCPTCERSFETAGGMSRHHYYAHGESIAGTEVDCPQCGAVHTVGTWIAKQRDRHFCRESCRKAWRSERWEGESNPNHKGKITVPCDHCGDGRGIYPSEQWKPHHFCNRPCYEAWFSENRSGEDSPHYDGGHAEYGAGWNDAKKALVRERDGRECRVCGKSELEHVEEHGRKHTVHHIVKARNLEDAPSDVRNGPLNLVTMCRDHHLSEWEQAPLLLQFMAFLPHPPLPTEQTSVAEFATDD